MKRIAAVVSFPCCGVVARTLDRDCLPWAGRRSGLYRQQGNKMRYFRSTIAMVGTLVLCALCSYGQSAPEPQLTKDSIVQMAKAGLPDDVIVSKIKSQATPPSFSTDDLIALKAAGVSDSVIRALVSPTPKDDPAPAAAPPSAPAGDPNDPLSAHDPGIYLMTQTRENGRRMVLIERVGSGRVKTAHILKFVMTDGIAKAQIRALVPGAQAPARADTKPEFYMYFPPNGNLGSADMISNPSQFSLLRLEKKKDHRETTVAKQGLGRASAGVDEKKSFEFSAERIRSYVYKVTPNASLKAGEYAFVAATGISGMTSSQVAIYDFGVDD
jgi:hypothetical protein